MKNKLEKKGIRGTAGKLIKSYLENRKQVVKINKNILSDEGTTRGGIPQGSSLGSTLFKIYIDDMINQENHNNVILYADDTAISARGKTVEMITETLQRRIYDTNEWMINNHMEINEDKTEYIIFHSPESKLKKEIKEACLKINNKKIETIEKINYLGITFDHEMKWHYQIEKIENKIKSLIPITFKIAGKLNENNKKAYYHAIIESRISYAISLWGRGNKTKTERLQRKQNTIIRILYKKDKRTNVGNFYTEKKKKSTK